MLPGDTVRAQVWVNYLDLNQQGNTLTNVDQILAALAGAPGYTVSIEGVGFTKIVENLSGATATAFIGHYAQEEQPRAYLSWTFVPQSGRLADRDGGYVQVSTAAAISKTSAWGSHE